MKRLSCLALLAWLLPALCSAESSLATRGSARDIRDPFELFGKTRKPAEIKLGRKLRKNEFAALQTLGLDENATPEDTKAKYKLLVKRLHPDANGGSRANEDTLKSVIHAYDTLRASGFC